MPFPTSRRRAGRRFSTRKYATGATPAWNTAPWIMDVFIPNPEEGRCPIILHPEECWYCGTCVNDCPRPGAVKFNWPLQQRGYWKRKETGQIFRV